MTRANEFQLTKDPVWVQRLLVWAGLHYPYFAYFQNNQVQYPNQGFKNQFFAGHKKLTYVQAQDSFGQKEMVGIIGYDHKNNIEKLSSCNPELLQLEEQQYFVPSLKIEFSEGSVNLIYTDRDDCFEEILAIPFPGKANPIVRTNPLTDKETYFSNIEAIKSHIREGDIYEMNYCMGFTFEADQWDPVIGFMDLMKRSPMPFSAFYHSEGQCLLCASPERFLRKKSEELIAQPIKGTIRRGRDKSEDQHLRNVLRQSEKEQAENLMIVDLMRNDLARISVTGSVEVEELFGIYPFPKVFQMISTVRSRIQKGIGLDAILKATFPMGSMTGAPKIKCMELIDRYEQFRRGWFSGALGYFQSNGDFDLNVVIRSIIFDQKACKGYFAVGSAITYDADAEYEYQECFLKAEAILEILEGETD